MCSFLLNPQTFPARPGGIHVSLRWAIPCQISMVQPLLLHIRCRYLHYSDEPRKAQEPPTRGPASSHHPGTSLVARRLGICLPVPWTVSSVPGPGRSYVPRSNEVCAPRLLSPHCRPRATAIEIVESLFSRTREQGTLEPVLHNKGSP